ncbi:MAG: DUF4391 domain-containing protein [Candidatus Paceibacterota bacterium]|jgi:hypothetical protein
MIDYFNIPGQARIDMPISKKLFAEKVALSSVEKRILREDIDRIVMKGLLQTRTVGVASYIDNEFSYDQIIFALVDIKNPAKTSAIAGIIQKAFPSPMILILNYQNNYCVNWCVKRINQADKSKRVIENMKTTRYLTLNDDDKIANDWLQSLDSTKIVCSTLKEWFDELSSKLLMLQVSDETGTFVQADSHNITDYRQLLEQLKENREEQRQLLIEIKSETQFNLRLKLTTKLKELQEQEEELKKRLK